jgi:hypothetical protein
MRKKWRSFRKKRNNNINNNIEYSLRSNKIDEIEKENVCDSDESLKKDDNNNYKDQEDVLEYLIQKSNGLNNKDDNNLSADETVISII